MTTEAEHLDISDLDSADVLAALYNAASPGSATSMGWLQFDAAPMTREKAQEFLVDDNDRYRYFDYVRGRCLKIVLTGDTLDPQLYDRDHGAGAARRAIETLRQTQGERHVRGA